MSSPGLTGPQPAGTPTPTSSCSPRTRCSTAGRATTRAVRHYASVGPIWAAEGEASLHLTLNPVVEDREPQAVTRSVLLIIDPLPPITIRTAAAITQVLRRSEGAWRIARRTVAAAADTG